MLRKRKRPFPGTRGVFDRKHPHSSYSQLDSRVRCPKLYEWVYRLGHKTKSIVRDFGGILHELVYDINRAAKGAPDGIGPEDLEKVQADPRLVGFRDFGWYITGCEALRRYAESVNAERKWIVEVEMPVQMEVTVRSPKTGRLRVMKFNSVIDRHDLLPDKRRAFWDYKLGGRVLSPSDLRRELQPNLYNLQLREHLGYHGKLVYRKYSLLSGKISECVFDEADAVATERYVKTQIAEQLGETKFPARFNDRCSDCPMELRRLCKEYASGAAWMEGKVLTASPKQYADTLSALKAHDANKKKLAEMIDARIKQEGSEIVEDGWRMWYAHQDAYTVDSFSVGAGSKLQIARDNGTKKR